jgi:hypothetical protein
MSGLFIPKVFSQEDSESKPLLSPSRQARRPHSGQPMQCFQKNERDHRSGDSATALGPDAEFGGSEAREKLEGRLLFKLDARMSILLFIYIPNHVSSTR